MRKSNVMSATARMTIHLMKGARSSIEAQDPWRAQKLVAWCQSRASTWSFSCSRWKVNRMRTVSWWLMMTWSCLRSQTFWHKSSFNLWPVLRPQIKSHSNRYSMSITNKQSQRRMLISKKWHRWLQRDLQVFANKLMGLKHCLRGLNHQSALADSSTNSFSSIRQNQPTLQQHKIPKPKRHQLQLPWSQKMK